MELVVFAGFARLDFAQGQPVVDLETGRIAARLSNLVAAVGNRADVEEHTVALQSIRKVAKDVGVVDRNDSKMIQKGDATALVVQLALRQCQPVLELTRWYHTLLVRRRTILENRRKKHFDILRRETLSPPTS